MDVLIGLEYKGFFSYMKFAMGLVWIVGIIVLYLDHRILFA
jgi:hypothetical protein